MNSRHWESSLGPPLKFYFLFCNEEIRQEILLVIAIQEKNIFQNILDGPVLSLFASNWTFPCKIILTFQGACEYKETNYIITLSVFYNLFIPSNKHFKSFEANRTVLFTFHQWNRYKYSFLPIVNNENW